MSTPASILQEETKGIPLGSLLRVNRTAKQAKGDYSRVFTTILLAFVVTFLLLLLLTGMSVYGYINGQREASDNARLGLSLIANSVRMTDVANAVSEGPGPEGPALVLTEYLDTGAYETRIYAYQGMIVEEYSMAEREYAPERAQAIVASKAFSFEYTGGLLTIHTDVGDACVMVHGQEGGA